MGIRKNKNKVEENELNTQQQKFVDNIISGMNYADAYRNAGYKGKGDSVYPAANQVFRNKSVQKELALRRKEVFDNTQFLLNPAITIYRRFMEMFVDPREEFDLFKLQLETAGDVFERMGFRGKEITQFIWRDIIQNNLNIELSEDEKHFIEAHKIDTKELVHDALAVVRSRFGDTGGGR